MPETTDIFEVMSTMRAMRRLKPGPVPDELINKILQAAQWAPSGGNTQLAVLGGQRPRDQEEGAALLQAPI
jgi:nitroreductase